MNNYWQKRYEKLKLSEMKKAEITAAKQKEIYQETLTRLRQQVLDWYDKYARENNISLADAQEQLTTSENKEFKITLEKYGELAKKENLSSEYKRLLENVSMKVRHARSQKLYIDTIHLVEQLAKTQKIQLEELLKDVYEDSVYKTAYEVQTMQGKYTQMQGPNEKEINEIIKKPWTEDGKEFSTRIWENKQKLVQTLTREMTRAFILKESTSEITQRITKRFNVSYNETKRLIETETAYIQEKAMLDTYDKLNVEKYEILAVLDSKTSEICRQMDGKVFERKDAKAGITLPPFHCYCRSTTVPYIEELDEEETRAARNEEDKTEFVPKMSYEEWKEKYVIKGENKQTKPLENGKTFSRSVKDITDKYTNKNKPSTGKLVYDKDYDVNKNVEEVEIAKWIHENIGGNIKLLTAVNEQNKKTADYLWNGKLWDLKSITTEKSADSSIRKGVKQIADNPGGIILNYVGKALDLEKLKEFAINRLNRSQVLDIEVIAVKDNKIVFVISNK
jgi:hypothetical protein|nr:MAG TPA: minor capsid protein [Caudoviricetes sp.]